MTELAISSSKRLRFAALAMLWIMAILLLFGLVAVPTKAAGSFIVTTTADTSDSNIGDGNCADNNGKCSLRAAIEQANALGAGSISLSVATYTLATQNKLFISPGVSINITGTDRSATIIDGTNDLAHPFNIFELGSNAHLTLDGVTVTRAIGAGNLGGAINSFSATLDLRNCVFSNNTNPTGTGGAIFSGDGGVLNITNCIFDGNKTFSNNGGALSTSRSAVTIKDSTFQNNRAETAPDNGWPSSGGAMWVYESNSLSGSNVKAVIDHTSFINNSASNTGGAIAANNNDLFIQNGSQFLGNQAQMGGGALDLRNNNYGDASGKGSVSITATTFTNNLVTTAVDPNTNTNPSGGAISAFGLDIGIHNSTFIGNTATFAGGAISGNNYNLTVENSTFESNVAERGAGAIFFTDYTFPGALQGNLVITGSTFKTNHETKTGSGTNDFYPFGGALSIMNAPASISNSTFSGNTALEPGGAIHFNSAGLLSLNIYGSTFNGNTSERSGGAINGWGKTNITNSTFSGNIGGSGAAINTRDDVATVLNSTISGNRSISGQGGGISANGNVLTFQNTILANNTGGNCYGSVTSAGNNLQYGDSSCPNTLNQNPKLDPNGLQDNGGLTQTIALLGGSPAIDSGNNSTCPAVDQRGVSRNGPCDIGAYEYTGGFVTGGGWINSPVGACNLSAACQNATGKANFGFNAKYKKDATIPEGNTEFQFSPGNLNFKATSYQWLVLAGAKAQFKGSGTINGNGNYDFIVTVIDGKLSSSGVDKFRIKIWDKVTGLVIYDNQMGAADDVEPSTTVGGGSIVIHKS
ncbi:MAG: hypothetical protein HXX08_13910 [Chloroflexi bacterium]|uniref:CSLREA domain-containing protein n=1 Tax=Candidatus Chlorohelix allophototropha TaxID=3003348 RepID=A0A8T7M4I3_9CHLR|nr:hypothetical protein [Chloroflexota bacterium]WJW70053.1 hypothetical protein OZ401_004855 [Chloroflexota bacterium L227-S17]